MWLWTALSCVSKVEPAPDATTWPSLDGCAFTERIDDLANGTGGMTCRGLMMDEHHDQSWDCWYDDQSYYLSRVYYDELGGEVGDESRWHFTQDDPFDYECASTSAHDDHLSTTWRERHCVQTEADATVNAYDSVYWYTYEYDGGNIVRQDSESTFNGEPQDPSWQIWEYDDDRLIHTETGGGSVSTSDYLYGEDGLLLQETTYTDFGSNYLRRFSYDPLGRLTEMRSDADIDGVIDDVVSYAYHGDGAWLALEEWDYGADGELDEAMTWTWECP